MSGRITYKGAPLKGGSVNFYSLDKTYNKGGPINEDGAYTVEIFAGEYNVTVETESQKPASRGSSGPPGKIAPKSKPLPEDAKIPEGYHGSNTAMMATGKGEHYVEIPKKYNKPEESGLKFTVGSGSQTYDIDLK